MCFWYWILRIVCIRIGLGVLVLFDLLIYLCNGVATELVLHCVVVVGCLLCCFGVWLVILILLLAGFV